MHILLAAPLGRTAHLNQHSLLYSKMNSGNSNLDRLLLLLLCLFASFSCGHSQATLTAVSPSNVPCVAQSAITVYGGGPFGAYQGRAEPYNLLAILPDISAQDSETSPPT